jgi:hypothetical protein
VSVGECKRERESVCVLRTGQYSLTLRAHILLLVFCLSCYLCATHFPLVVSTRSVSTIDYRGSEVELHATREIGWLLLRWTSSEDPFQSAIVSNLTEKWVQRYKELSSTHRIALIGKRDGESSPRRHLASPRGHTVSPRDPPRDAARSTSPSKSSSSIPLTSSQLVTSTFRSSPPPSSTSPSASPTNSHQDVGKSRTWARSGSQRTSVRALGHVEDRFTYVLIPGVWEEWYAFCLCVWFVRRQTIWQALLLLGFTRSSRHWLLLSSLSFLWF